MVEMSVFDEYVLGLCDSRNFLTDYDVLFGKSGSNIGTSSHIEQGEEPNEEANAFYRLLKDFEQPAYPGDDEFGSCKICGASRWKEDIHSGEVKIKSNGKKVPLKTMRYFPLKPRLQRLYMSRNIASFMRWHHDSRVDDGVMRHPADSMAWKHFDEIHKEFSSEPRNVRLGLASDGFQPFNQSKTSYSIWPVILIPYNLPPWMCMKDSNFILSILIPGPEGPGDAIDIYLKPLIEELRELWEVGVDTFDASTRQNFKLHASLLWTINDFPAYGNLSGWSTKGKMACPCCNKDTCSMRLSNCSKQCYMGHRRYLPSKHKWRNDKSSFDGTRELRPPPKSLSGSDILAQVSDLEGITLTKDVQKKRVAVNRERESAGGGDGSNGVTSGEAARRRLPMAEVGWAATTANLPSLSVFSGEIFFFSSGGNGGRFFFSGELVDSTTSVSLLSSASVSSLLPEVMATCGDSNGELLHLQRCSGGAAMEIIVVAY
nr:uncharacterized protein LOC109184453 [Ipomoea trifida]